MSKTAQITLEEIKQILERKNPEYHFIDCFRLDSEELGPAIFLKILRVKDFKPFYDIFNYESLKSRKPGCFSAGMN